MKRIILLALTAILALGNVQAQEVYNSSGKRGEAKYKANQQKKGFDVNRLIFGGGLGFGMGNGSISFGISPVVGYRITDNFSAGISLGYQYFRIKDYIPVYNPNSSNYEFYNFNSNMFSGGVWARYVIWQNIFAHVEFENNYTTYKDYYYDQRGVNSERISQYVPCLLLGGGFRQPIGENASFVVMALYDALQNIPSNTRVDPSNNQRYSISPYANRLDFRVGFNIGF